ncbi:hypothetical protein B1992_04685 [Pseudoxanthomonas broegbernensis]|uniref:Uncharacterized protein n=1 Tax=Pseudoxanthomonas broegbernensis TaxID=83619 RepID=A0A7V8K824_9GAMM|nr:hypothetical protein [Pseudoxanthomonas broegbernensis]KAF1687280.1 hypothetical protein B1992_04685 [Pseudoxanthomonas broegbernensis]MBB6065725.1 hypothetical protein [Pseudoxanthomonas broegbernensis]
MTIRQYKPLLWLAGVLVVVGLVLVFALRAGSDRAAAPAPADAPAVPPAASAAAPAPAAAAAPAETPPWLSGGQKAAAPAVTRALSAVAPHVPSAAEQTRKVAELREQAMRNERTADDLLRQIDAMKASGQAPPGVNLDALRSNLVVTKRAQVLARELAELTQQPETSDGQQRILAITAELQQLQSQLRYDVGTPAAVAPAVPAAQPGGRR